MPPYTLPTALPVNTSAGEAITAVAGGGFANATQLTARYNRVTTVATAADSVKLPPVVVGESVFVANDAAAALAVFPFLVTDGINAIAAGSAISIPAARPRCSAGPAPAASGSRSSAPK
jgi:hypothetical protein